jgi:hypothetical protein
MGNKQTEPKTVTPSTNNKDDSKLKVKEKTEINKNHFDFLYIVGRGGFGKVNILNFNIK